jgi:hypothetical protein
MRAKSDHSVDLPAAATDQVVSYLLFSSWEGPKQSKPNWTASREGCRVGRLEMIGHGGQKPSSPPKLRYSALRPLAANFCARSIATPSELRRASNPFCRRLLRGTWSLFDLAAFFMYHPPPTRRNSKE